MNITLARKWIGVGLLSSAMGIPALALATNSMVLPGSNFEIDDDANLVRDHDAPSFDWEQTVGNGLILVSDKPTGTNDNSFKGGTKEDTLNPQSTTGSIPNNKSDLKEFGLYQESNSDNEFLHLFWSRVQDPSGTTLMDFELNKGTALYPKTATLDEFPVREKGDLLIEYKLAQGGVTPELFLYRWLVDSGVCEASNSYPCWGNKMNLTGLAIGSINSNTKTSEPDASLKYSYDPFTFGEASIDLYKSLIFTKGQCDSFGYASLKSRSSDSFSAQMKDYIAPTKVNISNCADINVTKTDQSTPPVGLSGAKFALYNDVGNVGTYEKNIDTLVVFSDGVNTNPIGTDSTGQASWTGIFAGNYCVVEEEAPTGYYLDDPNWQCFKLLADDNKNLDFDNPPKPGEIKVTKKDDAGITLGDGWKFSLYADENGKAVGAELDSCTTTAGVCTIKDILPWGTYCVVESTNPFPTMYGDAPDQCGFEISGSSQTGKLTYDITFTNDRIPGKISVTKEDEVGNALGKGWIFSLYADEGGKAVGDALDSCTTDDSGKCTIEGILPPGTYCVVETFNPKDTEYGGAADQCKLDVTLGGTVEVTFKNPRIPGVINIRKQDDTEATLGDGWIFSLYTQVDGKPGTATGDSCTTVAGLCTIKGLLSPGTYCVVETFNPKDTEYGDADPQCNQNVTLGGTLNLTFTNPRLKGAILITKTRKHAAGGSTDQAHEGVTFNITGGDLPFAGVDVTTDEFGKACKDGLLVSSLEGIGDYTVKEKVPAGYQADSETEQVTVKLASTCNDGNEATVSFHNTPLTDITVMVDSLVPGGTASIIKCTDAKGNVYTGGTTDGDGSLKVSNLLPTDPAVTLTCEITVDP